jgi:plastocyanin
MMKRLVAFGLVAGCQLADPIDAPKCPKGSHPELQRCVADEITEKQIKLTACVYEPQVLTIKLTEQFQFDNTDDVPHDITGTEGTKWVTVEPKQKSPFVDIKKVGSWDYTVSGCSGKGTVKVDPQQ